MFGRQNSALHQDMDWTVAFPPLSLRLQGDCTVANIAEETDFPPGLHFTASKKKKSAFWCNEICQAAHTAYTLIIYLPWS